MDFQKNSKGYYYLPLALCIILWVNTFLRRFEKRSALNWVFYGPVEKVELNGEWKPTVTLNGKKYTLFWWDGFIPIHEHDTLIKRKGDNVVILIRKGTRDTIFSSFKKP